MSGPDTQRRVYWRTLDELAEIPEIAAGFERQAARLGRELGTIERRNFLRLMAASLALGGLSGGLSGCGPEENPRRLLPYVEQPPGIVPGLARAYATAVTESGYATGVLVTHRTGRPVKIEGNPDHPASRGAASAIMQASILGLYDPHRTQSILHQGQITSWEAFVTAIIERRGEWAKNHGAGLRLLTGTTTSPSLIAQITTLQQQFPAMRWHQWEPLDRDEALSATQAALYLERFIHGEIYKARPDVMAIVHDHSPALIPFGVSSVPLRPVSHTAGFIGDGVPIFDIRKAVGMTDMLVSNADRARALAASLGARSAVLMRGHGVTIVGSTIPIAVGRAIYLERIRIKNLKNISELNLDLMRPSTLIGEWITLKRPGLMPRSRSRARRARAP